MPRYYNSKISTTDITYEALFRNFKKGQRNGNWRKLKYAKVKYDYLIEESSSIKVRYMGWGKVSIEEAAVRAKVSVWKMVEYLREKRENGLHIEKI